MESDGRMKKGFLLTSNCLETSRLVLDALKNVERQGPDFLKECAEKSLATLETLRKCDDRSIVEELIDLVLGGCALVYIVIHTCSEHMDRQTVIARDMRSDAQMLALDLESIRVLVTKKTNGSVYRRTNPAKRSEDTRKIKELHKKLVQCMAKFGGSTAKSFHDSLEELISARLRQQDQENMREARKVQESVNNIQSVTTRENLHIRSGVPLYNTYEATATVGGLASHLQSMRITNDEQRTNTHHAIPVGITFPNSPAQPMQRSTNPDDPSEFPFPISPVTEEELRASIAGREEGRRTGDHLTTLQYLTPTSSHSATSAAHHSPAVDNDIYQQDEYIARTLDQQFRQEVEEIERQEQEDRMTALREAAQDQLRAEEDVTEGFTRRPLRHGPGSPASPSANISPFNTASAMSFSNVHGSGISVGGGPVNVYNGGGNTTNNIYRDSFNTHNTKHYYTT